MNQHQGPQPDRALAIVGVSCRLPGGIADMADLWIALREGKDLITEMPAERFDADRFVDATMPRADKSYTAAGGFLDDIAGFDAAYFGISPKEAAHMDPQHRLLLELTAEALDDAAIAPALLAGSDTAVYIGISDASYGALQMLKPGSISPYTMSGAASSIAANRLSHCFDLRGPSMAVDTACSSSLVALDRACHTLWEGTSRMVLCGGANILLSPHHYVGFSQASMLSERGRCASFSADADGFVRAEGGGMVLLKRLADALADGDRVHGVILGSASNSDGRTLGLSLPNLQAQEDLLRRVYADFGVHPDELLYFEAHGTGTLAGDPIEAQAIGQALGIRRITGPLPIGSVKTNVGHLEPASGMAGLCKALLVLRHRTVPASLHATTPNPGIDFTGLGLDLVTEHRALQDAARPVVGVNSFGFGGANAHTILTDAPPRPEPASCTPPPEGLPILVTARTPQALTEAVSRMAQHLGTVDPEDFYDLAYTSCLRRGKHEHRAAVLAHTPQEAADRLAQIAEEGSGPTAEAVPNGRVAFVFSGNGSQWAGMGADLLAIDPVFRAAVASVDAELAPRLGWSVAEEMARPREEWRLAATEVAQPLLFALQLGIVAVLRSQGVEPAMVLGHSVGEVAAAHTAGALTLAQAAEVITVRSQAQAATAGSGRMAAVGLSAEQAAEALKPYAGRIEIAGVNSGKDVTVAGTAEAIAALGEDLAGREVFHRDLGLDYAFHSRAMDGQHEVITAALKALEPGPAPVPLYSTVTGARIAGTDLDATYWWHNVREPVLFAAAVENAMDNGADTFVEIGPHPVLRSYLRRIAAGRPRTTAVLPTLHREADGPGSLATTRATLLAAGAATDWNRYFSHPGRVVSLPAYPWQREPHWGGDKELWTCTGPFEHPMLGARVAAPMPLWSGAVEPVLVPWLTDHRVAGSVVMPATGYVEMALAAGRLALDAPAEAEHLDITSALVIPWDNPSNTHVQVSLNPDDGTLLVSSSDDTAGEPRAHARARVRRLVTPRPAPIDLVAVRTRCPQPVTAEQHYTRCAEAGLGYGPTFQVLTDLAVGDHEVLAHYTHNAPGAPWTVHPALLDGALQAGAPLLTERLTDGQAYLPAAIGSVRVWATPGPSGTFVVTERSRTADEVCWDITITDPDGTVAVQMRGCRLRRFAAAQRTPLTVQHTVLRAAPHDDERCAPVPLPSPRRIVADCSGAIADLCADARTTHYEKYAPLFVDGFVDAFARAVSGLLPLPTDSFTELDLVSWGLDERHLRLWALLEPALRRRGILVTDEDGRHRLAVEDGPADRSTRQAVEPLPASVVEQVLAAQQIQHLPELLRGCQDPMELLADDATVRALEQFYDTAPFCRFHNRLAQILLRDIVQAWPADRPLRVLEIGAGTGGTTAALLPLLPADRTRYCFTDVSPIFFPRAQSRFGAYDFVDYRTLDLDADPAEQGYVPHGFDIVVAANALHTAKDLGAALHRVAGLLAPRGVLLGIEAHDPEVLAPFFGTLESFYGHTDTELRTRSLLLPREQWPALLERCGFEDVVQTGIDQGPGREHASVLLTRTAAATATGSDPNTGPGSERITATATGPSPAPLCLPEDRTDTTFLIAAETPDGRPLADALVRTVTAAGGTAAEPLLMPGTVADWETHLAAARRRDKSGSNDSRGGDSGTLAVVLVFGEATDDDPAEVPARAAQRAEAVRTCAVACDRLPEGVRPELWLVTHPSGVAPLTTDDPRPADAVPWGLGRCLANELPDLHCRRLSLHRTGDTVTDARRLAQELFHPTDEDELVLTAHGRFVLREQTRPAAVPATEDLPFTLKVRDAGLSYRLAWQESEPREPGPGEVLIRVRAAALNYRDIMQSVGLLPAEAVEGTPSEYGLGLECAGTVVACGPGMTALKPGDRVAGLSAASLASHTVAHAEALWPVPDDMTYTEAATMPVALATVHYSLVTLARLQPGETLLVHGAAGGVGLAAMQYAAACGAQVIATAGSDLKRDFLRHQGIQHVLDSRSLEFADQVREITHGRGVDVVLNSLAGEAITRSLELLRPGGRFLELGKRDIYENKPLLLRPFGNNIAFFGVDLTKVLNSPAHLESLRQDMTSATLREAWRPLPHSVFPTARVADAFALLQHSRHIGKVVVAFDPLDEPPLVERRNRAPRLDPVGTYLISGGTGGFGAATAHWLADLGARHLALVSRRGADAPECQAVLSALRDRGISATAHPADVTDLTAMREVVAGIDAGGHPLRGVVHSAMHLDDDLLIDLDAERMAAVMAPKIGGAVVLDALTRDRECDLFLLYSSGTAAVGNVKQAPYVAGNLCLEALARTRSRKGLPGLTLAWGALAETGYVTRNDLLSSLASVGLHAIRPAEAFAHAEQLMQADADVASVLRCDWGRTARLLPLMASPRLAGLVPPGATSGGLSREELLRKLGRMTPEEALEYITDTLTMMLAGVMQMDAAQIDPHRRVDTYGLDSLMAAELLVNLQQQYEVQIPPMELLRNANGTIADIAQMVYLRLGLARSTDAPVLPTPRTADDEAQPPTPLPNQLVPRAEGATAAT
ncbi:type I polyketide synthase [Streptomyces noursei]|uniref:type I polyketide synthase n=1 Tax=Streptomyces noursei TaxID=1971 RepID=UPI00198EE775|nr:type I polyketide synthase [Streptomyces noursei]MCZ1014078.1 type I polyketide synthase [Streptomyces noursei]GGX54226.1 type I polyketide synthase [Streptomyces noursei]